MYSARNEILSNSAVFINNLWRSVDSFVLIHVYLIIFHVVCKIYLRCPKWHDKSIPHRSRPSENRIKTICRWFIKQKGLSGNPSPSSKWPSLEVFRGFNFLAKYIENFNLSNGLKHVLCPNFLLTSVFTCPWRQIRIITKKLNTTRI